MTPEFLFAFASIVGVLLPELFSVRYATTIAWDAMKKSYMKDSDTVKPFFEDVESGKFEEEEKKEIVTKYFTYGFDVVNTYASMVLSMISALMLVIAYRSVDFVFYLGIGLAVVCVFMILEYYRLIAETDKGKSKLTVNSKELRITFKLALIIVSIIIILAGAFIPVKPTTPS